MKQRKNLGMANVNFPTALSDFYRDTHQTLAWLFSGIEHLELLAHPEPKNSTSQLYESRWNALQALQIKMQNCMLCALHVGRSQVVFGSGNPLAKIFILGEAPDANEDRAGNPFASACGELLQKMILAMGYRMDEVYLTNVVKCRPLRDRQPLPQEIDSCEKFLKEQVSIVQPQVILTMGKIAAQTLLRTEASLDHLRGKWVDYLGIPTMPTWHPSQLLVKPMLKKAAWDDLQKVMARLGEAR